MSIDYDPWGESHAPKRFERTDLSGRWSPIREECEPAGIPWVGWFAAGLFFGLMLCLGV